LRAIRELRSISHVIDMHQLTKDPHVVRHPGSDTASSPVRELSGFDLCRYLDYCSELLSIVGKLGALYGERLNDGVVLGAVDEIQDLTIGLTHKIWQKIALVDQRETRNVR
jgi:hypothetical protein